MPRRSLKVGEAGFPSTTRIIRTPNGWSTDTQAGKATHWEAKCRIGREGKPPKQLRRIATTRKEALALLDKAVQQEKERAQAAASHSRITPLTTPRTLWSMYAETEHYNKEISGRTRDLYRWAVRASQEDSPKWWDLPLNEAVTVLQWERVLTQCADRHGTSKAGTLRTALRNMLRLAADQVNTSSTYHMTLPKREVTNPTRLTRDPERALTPAEYADLQDKIRTDKYANQGVAADAILLNMYIGVRAGELWALTWDNVDLKQGTVHTYSQKTRHWYSVKKLPPDLADMLRRRRAQHPDDDRVFPVAETSFYRSIRSALTRVGYPWCALHNIRKTVGGIMFDAYGARAAAAWLAHTDVRTTIQYYVKVDGQAPTAAVDMRALALGENVA